MPYFLSTSKTDKGTLKKPAKVFLFINPVSVTISFADKEYTHPHSYTHTKRKKITVSIEFNDIVHGIYMASKIFHSANAVVTLLIYYNSFLFFPFFLILEDLCTAL